LSNFGKTKSEIDRISPNICCGAWTRSVLFNGAPGRMTGQTLNAAGPGLEELPEGIPSLHSEFGSLILVRPKKQTLTP